MRKVTFGSLVAGLVLACVASATVRPLAVESSTWLNTPGGQAPALVGRPVLVEFWTFGCVNCVRTIPAVREVYRRYSGLGLQVVGVHSPELDEERDLANVKKAITRLDVPYAVAIDNDFRIWGTFGNRYWPALYLLDRSGRIVWSHVGELHRETTAWTDLTARIDVALNPETPAASP